MKRFHFKRQQQHKLFLTATCLVRIFPLLQDKDRILNNNINRIYLHPVQSKNVGYLRKRSYLKKEQQEQQKQQEQQEQQ